MTQRDGQEFVRACAKFVLGESTGVRIKGSPGRLAALQEVLHASRDLYVALESAKPLSVVGPLIERKSRAAAKFKSETGTPWLL
ncbi:MAG: hypothetical protein EB060_11780 [Proteobacteria bacterium]|nr:hypothetical protein [Pseudomonadota bacterium]